MRRDIGGAIASATVVAAVAGAALIAADQKFGPVSAWWSLLVVAAWIAVFVLRRRPWLAAGAQWLQFRRHWVNLYGLTDIVVVDRPVFPFLTLTDDQERSVRMMPVHWLQRNQTLWDLVYNGILHAVITGQAKPSAQTLDNLGLTPDDPQTRMRHP